MKNYYESLGICENASEAEIKKAYFSMVRLHSPEQDPEKFQEIREAYEYLKAGSQSKEPAAITSSDPWAAQFYQQIKSRLSHHDYCRAANTAAEALYYFPKELLFRYYLAIAERLAGYTGKAVKSCEILVKEAPDNRQYHRELTMAYIDRGYRKKAISAFKKAHEMGVCDPAFMLAYSVNCDENKQYEEGLLILLTLVEEDRKWERDELPDILDAYVGACTLSKKCLKEWGMRIGTDLLAFIRKYTVYIDENADAAAYAYLGLMNLLKTLPQYGNLISDILHAFDQSLYSEQGRAVMHELQMQFITLQCTEDKRLGETIKRGLEAFLTAVDEIDDPTLLRYVQLDVKLCMIEELPGILAELDILKTDYPDYYKNIRDFAETLRREKNLKYLKDKMQKEYARFDECMSGGFYYELYPRERRGGGKLLWDEEQPFVREGKKVGRNDPCPCGSGKKYKQCCGKNA